jgi:hypothetical protein
MTLFYVIMTLISYAVGLKRHMCNSTAIRNLNHHVVTQLGENFPAYTGFKTASLNLFVYATDQFTLSDKIKW